MTGDVKTRGGNECLSDAFGDGLWLVKNREDQAVRGHLFFPCLFPTAKKFSSPLTPHWLLSLSLCLGKRDLRWGLLTLLVCLLRQQVLTACLQAVAEESFLPNQSNSADQNKMSPKWRETVKLDGLAHILWASYTKNRIDTSTLRIYCRQGQGRW